MSSLSTAASILLSDGELLRCADRGCTLHVLRGRVWLTRAGDADDHFLHAGQSMRLAAGARAVLSADGGPAEVRLQVAARLNDARNTPAATNRLPKVRFKALS